MKRILVALDGSESCKKASNLAEQLALSCNSEITFLTVLTSKSLSGLTTNLMEKKFEESKKEKEYGQEMLDNCKIIYSKCENNLKENNIEINRVVEEGNDPALKICDYAEKNNYDLIIIADKGKNKIKKFLLGSTTEKVVRHSNISVLVVK